MESVVFQRHRGTSDYERVPGTSTEGETTGSEDEYGGTRGTTHLSVSSEPLSNRNRGLSVLYHGTWPVERNMWNSEPTSLAPPPPQSHYNGSEMESVISFASSSGGAPLDRVLSSPDRSRRSSQQLEAKVDMVYSLLAMLGGQEHADMGETLLALSTSPESCMAMRQSGCIPLLVQLVQSDKNSTTRKKASQALHNLVYSNPDEKQKKRECRVLKLLEQTRAYISFLKNQTDFNPEDLTLSEDGDKHPVQTMAHLMKLSFDEGHRQAICHLGGIHIIASLIEIEHSEHGNNVENSQCVLLRRYGCMALTNLTFGDSGNKALLCSLKNFMRALVSQLQNTNDELCQVTASVLRNLSWRADSTSKEILREVGAVSYLMKAAMTSSKENTLKSILSALWNLSAHCSENKAEICAVEGALGFLVDMLSYKSPTKSLAIIENSGGILRNISSQIAVRDDYREILRQHNCLQILLDLLKSPSLTIVSNACGTLWNLSAKNAQDQEALWEMGAPAMLRSLNHSKHKMIAMGSSAALKNLLAARPSHSLVTELDSTAKAMDLPVLPSLGARKQKALMDELDQNLAETFENIDKDSPTKNTHEDKFHFDQLNKYIPSSRPLHKTPWEPGRSESQEYMSLTEVIGHESRNCKSDSCLTDDLNTAFRSLNISSGTASYHNNPSANGKLESSQFLKVNSKASTFCKIKNDFTSNYDVSDVMERPVDYSRKYNETKMSSKDSKDFASVTNRGNSTNYSFVNANNVAQLEEESFGIYAETDLDQPTNYSLRYGEDDSDSEDICSGMSKSKSTIGNDFVQDTVKTYCTEDTPYETPFNFSTATSMSDLREVNNDTDKQITDNDKVKTNENCIKTPSMSNMDDEKDHCSVEDVSETENRQENVSKPLKSEFSSGLMSPEKPINYAEEGTPGYFSRVSSFGSLSSMPLNEGGKDDEIKTDKSAHYTEVNSNDRETSKSNIKQVAASEGKAVKFEQGVNYAEETPLMFSRSSSLASLDSIEQHSIHEDRESVVSDFSRLTSGIVSPSELPDSPTQTVAPSPRRRKSSQDFPSTSKNAFKPTDSKAQVAPRTIQKPSVFEDNVTKFKEENTPVQFSTATSLSSLTFDDQDGSPRKEESKNSASVLTNDTVMENATNYQPSKENTEKQDVGQEKEEESSKESDNMPTVSESEEDEDILAACINDGMQNNRHRQSKESSLSSRIPTSVVGYKNPLTAVRLPGSNILIQPVSTNMTQARIQDIHSDTLHSYCTEDTPAMLSHAGSHCNLSTLSTVNETSTEKKEERNDFSDDSSVLSGDNENILAECIQSAMPKPKTKTNSSLGSTQSFSTSRTIQTSTPVKTFLRTKHESGGQATETSNKCVLKQNYPPYLGAKDETEKYAVENSPCHFSLRSSLSDLTIDGSICGISRNIHNQVEELKEDKPKESKYPSKTANEAAGPSSLEKDNILPHVENALSRRDSLSSLSVESFGSTEQEQALLEQCISSAMPKTKPTQTFSEKPTTSSSVPVASSSKLSAAFKKGNTEKEREFNLRPVNWKERDKDVWRESDDVRHSSKTASSKNAYATSATGNIVPEKSELCPAIPTTVAGGEHTAAAEPIQGPSHSREVAVGRGTDTPRDKCSPSDGSSSTEHTKSGSDKLIYEMQLTDSTLDAIVFDDKIKKVEVKIDNRMLDPEAMIESLDRFTAELVSQAEASHLNKDKSAGSTFEGDTWNDTSPNDVTFPSISGSAPNIITFKSETETSSVQKEYEVTFDEVDGDPEQERKSNDFSSLDSNTLTESTLIAMEATKMATVIQNQVNMTHSIASVQSLELDLVEPPSQMNSLTSSINMDHLAKESPKLNRRKKVLQPGLLARRALGASSNQASSLDNLSNLDSINPPSALGEVLDMEGSINSITSLTSETSDLKPDFIISGPVNCNIDKVQPPNPIFKVKQPINMLHLFENNSISDLEHINPPSLINEITDLNNSLADVSDTFHSEAYENCNTHVKTEDEVTHYSDAQNTTPIPSDIASSSTESTPKKMKSLHKRLTPKQRRNLTRERYRTYTVAAEMVVNEEQRRLIESQMENSQLATINNLSPLPSTQSSSSEKSTPKEKRQNDRDRFQTHVLDESVTSALQKMQNEAKAIVEVSSSATSSPVCSSPQKSPTKAKSTAKCSYAQKRLENRERFKTRTLSESSLSPDISSSSSTANTNNDDIHNLIRKEANLVIKSLKEARAQTEELLDCETLSLVSNDDDSEHNSSCSINYRTYTKSSGARRGSIPQAKQITIPFKEETTTVARESTSPQISEPSSEASDKEVPKSPTKPKIVKPTDKTAKESDKEDENAQPVKAIRGRRKPLYSKSTISTKAVSRTSSTKAIKDITSDLVKNVTSTFKSSSTSLSVSQKQNRQLATKPPVPKFQKKPSSPQVPNRIPLSQRTGVGSPKGGSTSTSANSSKVGSPVRTPSSGSMQKSLRKPGGGTPPVSSGAPVTPGTSSKTFVSRKSPALTGSSASTKSPTTKSPVTSRSSAATRSPTTRSPGATRSPSLSKTFGSTSKTVGLTKNSSSTKNSSANENSEVTESQHSTEGSLLQAASVSAAPGNLERQGTFTKEDQDNSRGSSKIPTPSLPKASASRIARPVSQSVSRNVSKTQASQDKSSSNVVPIVGKVSPIKSMSADRSRRTGIPSSSNFNRSPSVDSRLPPRQQRGQNVQPITQRSVSGIAQRSTSNSSISSNGSVPKKQVSKIASLWKKVEQQKSQSPNGWMKSNRPDIEIVN